MSGRIIHEYMTKSDITESRLSGIKEKLRLMDQCTDYGHTKAKSSFDRWITQFQQLFVYVLILYVKMLGHCIWNNWEEIEAFPFSK